ncbi:MULTISPECIES: LysR family transcriptional regulator [Sphingobium]|uniref:LysR family transcriptional regulator n=1 Tax=Sphingobium sp. MI1205 TaxID=407020 RepID=UPI00077051EE|nr:LysR substrate-binding domain-containing protein [Sphingobium sp. MI1205]AMK20391.1 LysR family transcriptional regulator [Sphingobium sp. MI1205]
MFDWDDLRPFLAVARMKRVAPASRLLGIDATTIARRLSRLSAALDAQLFEQVGADRILTQRGLALLAQAESVEGAALTALAEVKGERHSLHGHVRLSVAEGFGTWILAPALPAFHAEHPGIRLDIITASGFLNPSKREADMAVMLARPQRGDLHVQRLADYHLHLYASQNYLARRGLPRTRPALSEHALVGYVPEFLFSPELDYLDEVHTGLEASLRSSSIGIQRRLVVDGAGIGVLPDFMISKEDQLVKILAEEVKITRSFWLVTHSNLKKLARISAISNLIRERAAEVLSQSS